MYQYEIWANYQHDKDYKCFGIPGFYSDIVAELRFGFDLFLLSCLTFTLLLALFFSSFFLRFYGVIDFEFSSDFCTGGTFKIAMIFDLNLF